MTGAPLLVVLGPSGNGKTTLGTRLGEVLGVPFEDADDLHPQANIDKMAAGIPLTDEDRAPWLAIVHDHLTGRAGTGLVMACSALRRSYRKTLQAGLPGLGFVALEVPEEVLVQRVAHRRDHYMPASLVHSQLATYERLETGEPGLTLDGRQGPDTLVAEVQKWLARPRS